MQIIGIEESLYEKMLNQIEMLIFKVESLSQKIKISRRTF